MVLCYLYGSRCNNTFSLFRAALLSATVIAILQLSCLLMNKLSRMLAKKFVLVKPFEGLPKLTDFKIVEETLPAELQDGGIWSIERSIEFFDLPIFPVLEILTKAEWWTVDPYMRLRSVANMKIGDQFTGGQVAR